MDVKVGCCGFPRGMKHYFSQLRLVEVLRTLALLTSEEWLGRLFSCVIPAQAGIQATTLLGYPLPYQVRDKFRGYDRTHSNGTSKASH